MTATDQTLTLFRSAAGLLVDLDGTLADSSAPVRRAWTAFAARHGLDVETVLRRAQGRPSRETVRAYAPREAWAAEAAALEEAECTDTDGTRALPGASELLGSGRPLVLVTSCSSRLAAVRLPAAGLPVPPIVISADEVTLGKPDPECFTLGARALGLSPDRCLALEDSPAGVAAARAAGVPVIALRTTHAAVELAGADGFADDLAALLP
ncbi:MAG: HAD-IA family hydrolase [Solirubrobacteraceae bacterium]